MVPALDTTVPSILFSKPLFYACLDTENMIANNLIKTLGFFSVKKKKIICTKHATYEPQFALQQNQLILGRKGVLRHQWSWRGAALPAQFHEAFCGRGSGAGSLPVPHGADMERPRARRR